MVDSNFRWIYVEYSGLIENNKVLMWNNVGTRLDGGRYNEKWYFEITKRGLRAKCEIQSILT